MDQEGIVRETKGPGSRSASGHDTAERWIDELLPEDLDWEHLVRTYPVPCLLAAGAFGFLLGRDHGPALLAAISAFAGNRARQAIEDALESEGGS